MKSIKTKIIVSIIACTLLSAIPIGIMSLRNVYQTSNQAAEQELENRTVRRYLKQYCNE